MLEHLNSDEWQLQLISLYVWIEEGFRQRGWRFLVERFSQAGEPVFKDEEVLTAFIFARLRGHHTYKGGWSFLRNFLLEWFPQLPRYSAWIDRIHRLVPVLLKASEELTGTFCYQKEDQFLIDSCPIVMARGTRASRAKVAPELATRGYCASKSMHFYGIKFHAIVRNRPGQLPEPVAFGVSPASSHDLQALKACIDEFNHGQLFADLAYDCKSTSEKMGKNGCELCTPRKKTKGKFHFPGPDSYSRAVSKIRHPVETFFSWLQEKAQFQTAYRVRSEKGLLTFIWSSLLIGLLSFSVPS